MTESRVSLRNAKSKERGAAAVEFTLVIGVLVLIVVGIAEFGRLFWHYDALTKATRDGARLMSSSVGTTLNATEVEANQIVLDEAAGALGGQFDPALISTLIQCTYLSGGNEGSWGSCHNMSSMNPADVPMHVRVSITYTIQLERWWFPVPSANITLRPQTTMRYVYNN